MWRWILFSLMLFVVAVAARYLMPPVLGHYQLSIRTGGTERGIPSNLVAFWLVLAVGGIVILVKLIALIAGRAQK